MPHLRSAVLSYGATRTVIVHTDDFRAGSASYQATFLELSERAAEIARSAFGGTGRPEPEQRSARLEALDHDVPAVTARQPVGPGQPQVDHSTCAAALVRVQLLAVGLIAQSPRDPE